MQCVVNVQHDCYTCKCSITKIRPTWEERELAQLVDGVVHNGNTFVLNTAQMRDDAALISPHYLPVTPRDRERIIHEAARPEVELAKQRQRTTRAQPSGQLPAAPTTGAPPTSSPGPSGSAPRASASYASAPPQFQQFSFAVPQPHVYTDRTPVHGSQVISSGTTSSLSSDQVRRAALLSSYHLQSRC